MSVENGVILAKRAVGTLYPIHIAYLRHAKLPGMTYFLPISRPYRTVLPLIRMTHVLALKSKAYHLPLLHANSNIILLQAQILNQAHQFFCVLLIRSVAGCTQAVCPGLIIGLG